MKIPSNNQWTQLNNGTTLGIVNETHNFNFDLHGEAMVSKKSFSVYDDGDDADFGLPLSIGYNNGVYHVTTDEKTFAGDLQGGSFSELAAGPTASARGDGIACFDRWYVSSDTDLAYYDSGWTTGLLAITAGTPHPMAVFDSLTTHKLAIASSSNVVKCMNSSHTVSNTLTLSTQYRITSLAYRNGWLYVGTRHLGGGEAQVFMWNGDGANAQYSIPVGASYVYCVVPYRGTVALVTNEGELLVVNGTSLERLSGFPIFYKPGARWEEFVGSEGKISKRGMAVLGDVIYINVNGKVDVGDVYGMKSGMWCYDPRVGLYHLASHSSDKVVTDSGTSVSSSVITTSATHSLKLGDAVTFKTVSGLTGVSADVVYYAIPVAATTLKIARSVKNAFEGNNITLGGSVTTDVFVYAPNTDIGYLSEASSGAICITNYLEPQWNFYNSELLYGATVKNQAGSTKDTLLVLSDSWNEGAITTQKVYAKNLVDTWNTLTMFLNRGLGSNENSTLAVRIDDSRSFPSPEFSLSWVDGDTFTTTDNSVFDQIEVGDEIHFYSGYGQGRFAYVTEASSAGSTTTVTIDQSYGTAAGSSTARMTDFKKIQANTGERSVKGLVEALVGKKSPWIMLKAVLRGFETKIAYFDISSEKNK